MSNITIVDFRKGETSHIVHSGLWQWDYGQILRIQGLSLPSVVEIHFSLQENGGEAKRRIGITESGVTDVVIPDFILEGNNSTREFYEAYAFIYLSDEESGETTHKIVMRIKTRPEPEGANSSDETTFGAIIKEVRKIAEQSGVSDEKIRESVNEYMEDNPLNIPTKTSELENDSGFLTDEDMGGYAKTEDVPKEAADIGAEESGTAETKVSEHNTSSESHTDIRLLISNLSNAVTALLDSDDETLNQTSEIVAYIKSNKSLIDAITTSKVSVTDIIDNITTNVSDKPLSAAQGVVLKGLIDTVRAELNKIVIPTKLPNPHKLVFAGAVAAEYDGSGAVTVTIPSGEGSATERIEKDSTETEVTIEPNKLYIFPEMSTLTVSLGEIADTSIMNEYHFIFQSGATATTFSIPQTIKVPDSFTVDASKIYEVSIMENCLTYQSWAVS